MDFTVDSVNRNDCRDVVIMNTLFRYKLTIALSTLAGIGVCCAVYVKNFSNFLPIKPDCVELKHVTLEDNTHGLFGYNLDRDFKDNACSHQPLQLNGMIIRNNDYLFNIVGTSAQRLYRPTERIDEKYPVIAYSRHRVLLRVAGKEVLLCNHPLPEKTTLKTLGPVESKDITMSYATLSAQKDAERNITGYAIKDCTWQCRLGLKMAGLEPTDLITAINERPFTSPEVLQQIKATLPTLHRLQLSVLRHGKKEEIIISNTDDFAKLFPSQTRI